MRLTLLLILPILLASAAQAQDVAAIVRAGSGGFGADLGISLTERVQLRIGGTYVRWRPGKTSEKYGLPTLSRGAVSLGAFGVTLDLYPGPEWFRITAGAWSPATEGRSTIKPQGPLEIDDGYFSIEELGEVDIRVWVKNSVAPYLGLGIGNPLKGSRIAVLLDVGFYYHGTPQVRMRTDGRSAPMAGWEAVIAESMESLTLYPVAQIGLSFGL